MLGLIVFCILNYAIHVSGLVLFTEESIQKIWRLFLFDKDWPALPSQYLSDIKLSFLEYQAFLGAQMAASFVISALLLLRRLSVKMGLLKFSTIERLKDFSILVLAMLVCSWILTKNSLADPAGNSLPLSGGPTWWKMIYLGGMWPFILGGLYGQLINPALMNEHFERNEKRGKGV